MKIPHLWPVLLLVSVAAALQAPALSAGAALFPVPQGAAESADDQVLKTLAQWLKLYRSRSLEPGERRLGSKSLLKKAGLEHLASPGGRGRGRGAGWPYGGQGRPGGPTGEEELRFLLRDAVRIGSVAAAGLVLQVAAIGLDRQVRYTPAMQADSMRRIGESHLARMTDAGVRGFLLGAASADGAAAGSQQAANRIAALRALTSRGGELDLRLLQRLLANQDPVMRQSAAEGLGRVGEGFCAEWLAEAIERETSPTVLIALTWAIRDIHGGREAAVKPVHLERAIQAVGRHLATVTERATAIALVDFLDRFRHRSAVPALIGLLERFQADKGLARDDRLTPDVQRRANDTLRALTGAMHPAERPEDWRAFWGAQGDKIDVAQRVRQQQEAARGTVSFFGIPVTGRRVVFVIDVSGSMEWPMPQEGGRTSASRGRGTIRKIDKAKQELLAAVNALPPRHKFNVIFYSNEVSRWRDALVPASAANKQALAGRLRDQGARGGTNLFGGVKLGLELKSQVYGSRYDSHVDEIFILSDGVPTVGEVTDMEEILRRVGEVNRYAAVRINAIYLGSKSDERRPENLGRSEREGGEFLKKLADQNGGGFSWPVTANR